MTTSPGPGVGSGRLRSSALRLPRKTAPRMTTPMGFVPGAYSAPVRSRGGNTNTVSLARDMDHRAIVGTLSGGARSRGELRRRWLAARDARAPDRRGRPASPPRGGSPPDQPAEADRDGAVHHLAAGG